MDVIASLEPFLHLSQLFGLVSFEVALSNGVRVLQESGRRTAYTRTLFALFCVLQTTVVVKTLAEIFFRRGSPFRKTLRLLHLLFFTANVASVYLTAMTRGKLICSTINLINRQALLLPRKETCRRLLSKNSKLMFCVLFYFPTIFLGSVNTIYSYQRDEWYPVYRSSFFAFNTWMENLFQNQFLLFANCLRAVLVGYNESFLRPPGKCKRRTLKYFHKMKSADLILKTAFHLLNSAYKYNLLFGTAWIFMALLYFINKSALQVNFVFWALYAAFRMSSLLCVCDRIAKEVEKTAHHLHELFIEIDDPVIKEEIEIFSLQLMHRKAEFNACGFFKLDFSLLHSMIATVSTYIIILMQLQGDTKLQECVKFQDCSNCSHVAAI